MITTGKNFGRRKMPFFFFIKLLVMLALGGLVVMLLWNAILPELLALKLITYGQAVGLIILVRILTGGFRPTGRFGAGRFGGPPPHITEKWKNMSDEERQAFRAQWKRRCAEKGKGSAS